MFIFLPVFRRNSYYKLAKLNSGVLRKVKKFLSSNYLFRQFRDWKCCQKNVFLGLKWCFFAPYFFFCIQKRVRSLLSYIYEVITFKLEMSVGVNNLTTKKTLI